MVSLSKLEAGEIASITAVDNSATYEGWEDLRETIKAILLSEGADAQAPHPWINTSEFDHDLSQQDHCDHYATGSLTNDAYFAQHYNRALWRSYDIQQDGANLSSVENSQKWESLVPYGQMFYTFAHLSGLTEPGQFELEQKILEGPWNGRAYWRAIYAA